MKRAAVPPVTNRLDTFLQNIRGVFYYGIPDERSKIEELAEQSKNPTLELLLTIAARRLEINEEFRQRTELHARSFAVLEGRKTKYLGFDHMVVGAARSVRYEVNSYVDKYIDTTADHFGVCRPASKQAATYTILQQFVASALADGLIRQYAGLVLRRCLPSFGIGGPVAPASASASALVGTKPKSPASKEEKKEPPTVPITEIT